MDSRLSAEEPLHLLKVHYFPSLQLSFRMTGAAAAAGWVKKQRGAAGRQGDGVTTQATLSVSPVAEQRRVRMASKQQCSKEPAAYPFK